VIGGGGQAQAAVGRVRRQLEGTGTVGKRWEAVRTQAPTAVGGEGRRLGGTGSGRKRWVDGR